MRCDAVRENIQDWLDLPGAATLSREIGDHLRDCAACRSFIREWNLIEVGLQSLRDQTPALSADFGSKLRARIHSDSLPRTSRVPASMNQGRTRRSTLPHLRPHSHLPFSGLRLWHFALVGGSAIVLLLLALQLIPSGRTASSSPGFAHAGYNSVRRSSQDGLGGTPLLQDRGIDHAAHGLATDLPLANTH